MALEMTEAPPAIAVQPPPSTGAARTRVWVEKADKQARLMKEGPLLVLCASVLALSFVIPTLKSRHLWLSAPCIFYTVTRIPCPMCGMTRSFIFTAHGNLSAAFNMHLLGPLIFFLVALCGLYLATSLVSGYRVRYELTRGTRRAIFWSVLGVFLACWVVKLVFMRGAWS